MIELVDICETCKQPVFTKPEPVIEVGPLWIEPNFMAVMYDGKKVHLTDREFQIILLLARRRGQVVSKDAIFNVVWGDSDVETKIIDVYVCKIRRKLGIDDKGVLQTVWGRGYALQPGAQIA